VAESQGISVLVRTRVRKRMGLLVIMRCDRHPYPKGLQKGKGGGSLMIFRRFWDSGPRGKRYIIHGKFLDVGFAWGFFFIIFLEPSSPHPIPQ
jgi:hypothetical protein